MPSWMNYIGCLCMEHESDESVEQSAARVVKKTEDCHGAKSITELLRKANVSMDHDRIIEELQKGIISA